MTRGAVAGLAAAALAALSTSGRAQSTTVAGKPYRKLATREATAAAFRGAIEGADVEWGPWQATGAFALPGGSKAIATVPDTVARAVEGKALAGAFDPRQWRELDRSPAQGGADGFALIELNGVTRLEKTHHQVVYLHRTITARSPAKLRVAIGSDDGLRLWLDGALQVDDPAEHGFEPEQHVLEWKLAPGRHDVVAKIAQDEGGWSFALTPQVEVDRLVDAALEWQLELDFPEGESRHWRIASLPIPAALAV